MATITRRRRKRQITIRCTRSRGPRGFFCLQVNRRGPVNVDVIRLISMYSVSNESPIRFTYRISHLLCFAVFCAALLFACSVGRNHGISRGLEQGRWLDRESEFQTFVYDLGALTPETGNHDDQLLISIQSKVLPYSWESNGGSASIDIADNSDGRKLIVRHTIDGCVAVDKYVQEIAGINSDGG